MGGGFLPVTIHNNELYFLFGRENEFADTPGFSDFGGGQDHDESSISTALREFVEETSGFMGNSTFIKNHIQKCNLHLNNLMYFDLPSSSSSSPFSSSSYLPSSKNLLSSLFSFSSFMITQKRKRKEKRITKETRETKNNAKYRMYLYPMIYTNDLPIYFNNMQSFIKNKLSSHLRKTSKIFEKDFIKWFSWKELQSQHIQSQFRSYFQNMLQSEFLSPKKKKEIYNYVRQSIDNLKISS